MLRSFGSHRDLAFRNPEHAVTKRWRYLEHFIKSQSNYALYQLAGVSTHFSGYRDAPIHHHLTEEDYKKAVRRLSQFDHIIIQEAMNETRYVYFILILL